MKELFVMLLYSIVLGGMWYFIGYTAGDKGVITTPLKVEFATQSCKLGEWKTIDRNIITCEDGAVYKYDLED